MKNNLRVPAAIALAASVLGLVFAAYSTFDYVQHLDRQLHDVHCSIVPGLAASAEAANPCRVAMYSAYSAVFRGTWWGGIPLSLLALGVYVFFTAFSVALVVGGPNASRRAYQFFGFSSLFPLLMSVVMATISAIKLGVFCHTCVGLYAASVLLAAGGIWALVMVRGYATRPATTDPQAAEPTAAAMPKGHAALIAAWMALLGASVLLPTVVYAASLPEYRSRLLTCGKLTVAKDKSLVTLATQHPVREVTLFDDPLCPVCKALHQRLEAEGAIDRLLVHVAMMPLDSNCNWMVDRSLHPGSCVLAKAFICAEPRSREALEWMFDNQEELAEIAKAGEPLLRARIRAQLGAEVDACIDDKKTTARLHQHLQFAVANHVPVSTPQLYLGEARVCDEDTDLGLRYTLQQLAPEVLR